jgi:thermolabile hemolysin
MYRRQLLALLVAPIALSVFPTTVLVAQTSAPTKMIVFGASSADSGSAFALTGGAFPAPPYWQGRFSNGPNWVDQLATLLKVPVPGPFPLGGDNFAVAGAQTGAGFSNVCVGSTCAPNMGLQIHYYLSRSPVITGKELFVLQGGGNDFALFTGLNNALLTAYEMRVNIETLAKAGATRFAVINLGVDNLSPTKWLQSNNVWIQHFNSALQWHLKDLKSKLGLTIAHVDYHSLMSAMIADPASFGLKNVTDAAWTRATGAVSNPDEYFYWDGLHPTTVVHRFIANLAAASVGAALGL